MLILNSKDRLKRIGCKGIIIDGDEDVLKRYSYYQLINGYKYLFVRKVLSIEDVINSIEKGNEYKNAVRIT